MRLSTDAMVTRVIPPGPTCTATMTLEWTPQDPHELRIILGDEDPWPVDLSVLRQGLDEPAGIGQVRMWPLSLVTGTRVLMVALELRAGLTYHAMVRHAPVRMWARLVMAERSHTPRAPIPDEVIEDLVSLWAGGTR